MKVTRGEVCCEANSALPNQLTVQVYRAATQSTTSPARVFLLEKLISTQRICQTLSPILSIWTLLAIAIFPGHLCREVGDFLHNRRKDMDKEEGSH